MSELANEQPDLAPGTEEIKPTETVETQSTESEDSSTDGNAEWQKQVNKQHFKFRTEERKRIEVERERDELKAKMQQDQLATPAPEIPPIPDALELDDEEFRTKINQRDDLIRKKAEFDGQQQLILQAQQQQQQADSQQQAFARQELGNKFSQNAISSGMTGESLQQIITTLNGAGLSTRNDIADHLMGDDDGPIISQYLASNPVELDTLLNSTAMQAGAVYQDIRAKAVLLKPKQSLAPDPALTLSGTGAPPADWFKKKHPGAVIE